jgi:hypothetical protein
MRYPPFHAVRLAPVNLVWVDSRTLWGFHASPTCRWNGPASTKYSAFQLKITHSNRVSSNQSLRCRETEFSGQRQRRRNGFEGSRTLLQRQNLAKGDKEHMREIGYRCRKVGSRWHAWLLVKENDERRVRA